MKSAVITDIGLHRKRNEDSFFISQEQGIFIVCDGMGGHKGGNVASSMAVQIIKDNLDFHVSDEMVPALRRAVQTANKTINEMGMADEALREMGTTVTAAVIQGDLLIVAHVGDSSLYLYHDSILKKITRDHTLSEQMLADGILTNDDLLTSSYNHILTRAVGVEPNVAVDIFQEQIQAGDWILVCTDGLTDLVTDEEITLFLRSANDPEATARILLDTALAKGGYDNITIMLISV